MKAKLQKHFAYKYKDKKHYKYVVIIPDGAINKLGWKARQELELNVKSNQLTIKPKKSAELHGES